MSEENLSSASGAVEAPSDPGKPAESAASGAAGEPGSSQPGSAAGDQNPLRGLKTGLEVRIEALEAQMEELLHAGVHRGSAELADFGSRLSELEHAVASHAGTLFSQSEHDGLSALKRWFAGFLGRQPKTLVVASQSPPAGSAG